MFERSEFGFLRLLLASFADLSATWFRSQYDNACGGVLPIFSSPPRPAIG